VAGFIASASAQTWPSKSIHAVIPFGPGSAVTRRGTFVSVAAIIFFSIFSRIRFCEPPFCKPIGQREWTPALAGCFAKTQDEFRET